MNSKDFTFIIPTYTNHTGLQKLLKLLSSWYPKIPIIIVNNNPDKTINSSKKNVTIIQNSKNEGFASACNRGAKKAHELFKPEFLVFLNDDISFESDWLLRSVRELQSSGWVAVSPVLRKADGFVENCGYKVLPKGKIKLITSLDSKEEIDGISATALLIRTTVFFKLGGFDERFFAYLEDVDLFLRSKKQGDKFGVAKQASVIHEGQKTSEKFKTRKTWLDTRNWILLIAKNWTGRRILVNLPAIIFERLRNVSGLLKSLFK